MNRRAFTLLETVLAMVVGILVLTAALGVMSSVRGSDTSLAIRATQQRELADTRIAVASALSRLRPAPNNIIRQTFPQGTGDDAFDAIFDTAYPAPIEGLPHHFELSDESGKPTLEVVVDRLPQGTYQPDAPTEQPESATGEVASGRLTFDDLLGFRGAFELRPSEEITAYELWWKPLPPRTLPAGAIFDESTLPEPKRLCGHVAELRWSAFIDSTKVARVRAVEARQLPAYIELEITTTDGLYASWMFELGWIPGLEVPESEEAAPSPVPPDTDPGLNSEGEFNIEPDLEFGLEGGR